MLFGVKIVAPDRCFFENILTFSLDKYFFYVPNQLLDCCFFLTNLDYETGLKIKFVSITY